MFSWCFCTPHVTAVFVCLLLHGYKELDKTPGWCLKSKSEKIKTSSCVFLKSGIIYSMWIKPWALIVLLVSSYRVKPGLRHRLTEGQQHLEGISSHFLEYQSGLEGTSCFFVESRTLVGILLVFFFFISEHPRGHFCMFSCTKKHPRGHFFMYSPLLCHLKKRTSSCFLAESRPLVGTLHFFTYQSTLESISVCFHVQRSTLGGISLCFYAQRSTLEGISSYIHHSYGTLERAFFTFSCQ